MERETVTKVGLQISRITDQIGSILKVAFLRCDFLLVLFSYENQIDLVVAPRERRLLWTKASFGVHRYKTMADIHLWAKNLRQVLRVCPTRCVYDNMLYESSLQRGNVIEMSHFGASRERAKPGSWQVLFMGSVDKYPKHEQNASVNQMEEHLRHKESL